MLRTLIVALLAVGLLVALTGCPKTPEPASEAPMAMAPPAPEAPAADKPAADASADAAPAESVGPKVDGEEGKPVQKTESGLQYVVLDEGTGDKPIKGDKVVAEYTGWLTDGTKFDSSKDHPGEFEFAVGMGEVIPAWDEAFLDMKPGERRKLIIPSDLAYGPESVGPIPPNSKLIFEVTLVKVAK